MANDLNLQFHGTQAAGTTFGAADTTGTNGPVVDLGSTTIKRTLLLERRIAGPTIVGFMDIAMKSSVDNSTYVNMPGTTTASLLGFARATTSSYASTDAIAPSGPNAVAKCILQMPPGHRFVRATFTCGTTASFPGVSVIAKVLPGAFSGLTGPIA